MTINNSHLEVLGERGGGWIKEATSNWLIINVFKNAISYILIFQFVIFQPTLSSMFYITELPTFIVKSR